MDIEAYREEQRRALNIIWTMAEDYSFRPVFMAFDRNERADLYLNSVIGWTRKWYKGGALEELPGFFEGTALQDVYDTVYWLCLENCVYQKEYPRRPVVRELRREYASGVMEEDKLGKAGSKRVNLEGEDWGVGLAYTLKWAHFCKVLGVNPFLLPWEKKLSRALEIPGDVTGDELAEQIKGILWEYFRFRCIPDRESRAKKPRLFEGLPLFRRPGLRLMATRMEPEECLVDKYNRKGDEEETEPDQGKQEKRNHHAEGLKGWITGLLEELQEAGRDEWAREYIEMTFGRPVWNEQKRHNIESLLCTGNHRDCHLYLTRGERQEQRMSKRASNQMEAEAFGCRKLAVDQEKKNLEYYDARRDVFRSCILRLKEQIVNTCLVQQEPELVASRQGKLKGNRIWRQLYLGDNRIFTKELREDAVPFSVDLMLDGSASQVHQQEMIASQGYMIAESLRLCGIPVQVCSFCSFHGYTVLRLLREYGDREGNRNIFRYYACGWNRDGLALRGAGYLMEGSPCSNRLLIILTDASPNDDKKMPANEHSSRKREYEQSAAIADTAQEVRMLRKKGIRVIGVFYGLDRELKGARAIYGSSFARIREAEQLADTVGGLIRKEITGMAER